MSSDSVTVVERVQKNPSPSGPAAYAKVVKKYNLDTPSLVAHDGKVYKRKTTSPIKSLRKYISLHHSHPHSGEDLDEVSAKEIQEGAEYVVPVTIGTPGITLNLDFDTGSGDLWVWSTGLTSSTHGHPEYDPKKSSTAKQVEGATWKVNYGDGSYAGGNVFTDVVKIGNIEIREQAVEAATKLSVDFLNSTGSDGLCGLGWPQLNTVKPHPVKTPVENIISQKLTRGLFSAILNEKGGYYTFGGIDPIKAGVEESEILYTPVDHSKGYWEFKSEAIVINGKTVEQPGNTAILDSGSTLCALANETVQEIYSQIPGAKLDEDQGGWIYPEGSKIPDIEIFIGEHKYRLYEKNFGFGEASKGFIFGGIQPRGNHHFDLLGDNFMKGIYSVFDQEGARVGAAQRRAH